MKRTTIILLIVFAGSLCRSQTFEEWFEQKDTQKKYLLQQIAAFKVYLGYVQNGYAIAQKGLTTISRIKKGDFNLHQDFFASLKNVNHRISSYAKVGDIIVLQIQIAQVYENTDKQVRASGLLNTEEVEYIFKVFTNLLEDCRALIVELTMLITPGALEMNDDERLQRIDALYSTMQEHYAFALHFGNEAKLLAVQRMKEKKDVQTGRALNGLKSK